MSKLLINKSKSKKVKMSYSSGHPSWSILMVNIYISTCTVLRISPGQGQNNQLFGGLLVSVKSIEKVNSTQEQVQKYCNWRKESFLRL